MSMETKSSTANEFPRWQGGILAAKSTFKFLIQKRLLFVSTLLFLTSALYMNLPLLNSRHLSREASLLTCDSPNYTVRILSYNPLMVHVENFLTLHERQHLLALSEGRAIRSLIDSSSGISHLSPERTSSTAFLPATDHIANCVRERAAEFQGYIPVANIERLQVTHYDAGQEFKVHYDWRVSSEAANRTGDRLSTFFGILESNCENCGTWFPRMSANWAQEDKRWCHFVNCSRRDSLEIIPVPGSALFWRNLHEDGSGDESVLHAGLKVESGVKVGLNIWTSMTTQI